MVETDLLPKDQIGVRQVCLHDHTDFIVYRKVSNLLDGVVYWICHCLLNSLPDTEIQRNIEC